MITWRKIITASLLLITMFFAGSASAQTASGGGVNKNPLPEIYVQDLRLERSSYEPGEEVRGTFVIWNYSGFDASGIKYLVSLMGDYKSSGVALKEYDTVESEPIFLSAKEKKVINFSYRLPKMATGERMAITIQAILPSGLPRGWADAPISLRGEAAKLEVVSAFIRVGEKDFALGVGPTIAGPKGVADLVVTLSNKSATPLDTNPNLKVGSTSLPLEPIKLKAGETRSLRFSLPTFGYSPAVYEGELRFLSSQGIQQTILLPFRYIVGGNMVRIHSLSASQNSNLQAGQTVALTFGYSGTPYDIVLKKAPTSTTTNILKIELFNERNRSIGSLEEEMDFNVGNSKTTKIVVSDSARTFRAVLTVRDKTGQELARYESNLSPLPASWWSTLKLSDLIILFVIVLLVAFLFFRRLYRRPQTIAKVGLLVLLIVPALFLAKQAEAFDVVEDSTKGYKMAVFVSSPSPTMTPDQEFFVQFNLTAEACVNQAPSFWLHLIYDPQTASNREALKTEFKTNSFTLTENSRVNCTALSPTTSSKCSEKISDHSLRTFNNVTVSKDGAINTNGGIPFKAPSTPGVYAIALEIHDLGDGDNKGTIVGVQYFTVVATSTATLSATCSPNPASLTAPGSVTWMASPSGGSGPYRYSWNFDNGGFGSSSDNSSVRRSYSANGTYTAKVKVSDSSSPQGQSGEVSCSSLVVGSGSCTGSSCPGPGNNLCGPAMSANICSLEASDSTLCTSGSSVKDGSFSSAPWSTDPSRTEWSWACQSGSATSSCKAVSGNNCLPDLGLGKCGSANNGSFCSIGELETAGVCDFFSRLVSPIGDPVGSPLAWNWFCKNIKTGDTSDQCSASKKDADACSLDEYNMSVSCTLNPISLGGKSYCPVMVSYPATGKEIISSAVIITQTGSSRVIFDTESVKGLPKAPSGTGFISPVGVFSPSWEISRNERTMFAVKFSDRGTTEPCESSPYGTSGKVVRIIPKGLDPKDCQDPDLAYPNPNGRCPAVALVYSDPRSCSK